MIFELKNLSLTHNLLIESVNPANNGNGRLAEMLADKYLDWNEVLNGARSHGITSLLHQKLTNANLLDLIPQQARQTLQNEYLILAARALVLRLQMQKLLASFNKAGIEVIVLKGAALAETIYSDFLLRPYGDIDLLVQERDWEIIGKTLSELNFSISGSDFANRLPRLTKFDVAQHLHFLDDQGTNLELQFDPLQLGLGIKTINEIWQCADVARIAGVTTKILSPEYQLLHLCVHLNKHGYRRLLWFIDIALHIKSSFIDWKKLRALAKTEGVLPSIYFTLYYLNVFFGRLVPSAVIESLKPDFVKRLVWQKLWPADKVLCFNAAHETGLVFHRELPDRWFIPNLLLAGRASEKLHYFWCKAFPPQSFICRKYLLAGERINPVSYAYYCLMRIRNRNIRCNGSGVNQSRGQRRESGLFAQGHEGRGR